ncbi:hypothetical protein MPTK1_5g11080 [Marchantia polymorpha subsp. ruderalis]|uniref:Uncharacterized protein n=2 Tax=Marchantia polymorpha TaxID=3197 RepID=A0AAF6BH59_MARPO|nr:hypothetical protein MARPO_0093s0030 [Marchantia polymorpha]BBN11343.1 hypothetical protein Mp_5g11080 [Marchantia polymorpha subsp. ruderalis]|eukprot:PTQ32951.1 hypothetical protein MARPO_0093s0030 [Marchantia polymorpha]
MWAAADALTVDVNRLLDRPERQVRREFEVSCWVVIVTSYLRRTGTCVLTRSCDDSDIRTFSCTCCCVEVGEENSPWQTTNVLAGIRASCWILRPRFTVIPSGNFQAPVSIPRSSIFSPSAST